MKATAFFAAIHRSAFFLSVLVFTCHSAAGQNFPGYRTGNYSGVNGVFFNPASIADNRYKWDVNLFSFNAGVANDQASFNRKDLDFSGDKFEQQLFGADAKNASALMELDFRGPSAMFHINENNSLAITTRAKALVNVSDIDGQLFDRIINDVNNSSAVFPYTVSSNADMRVVAHAWSEFGVSYARVLPSVGPHFMKAGITLKYLSGAGNGYISVSRLNGTIEEALITSEPYLRNTTGHISMGFGGVNTSDLETNNFTSFRNGGLGADLGFVYEYRPDNPAGKGPYHRSKNLYKFRAGFALLDLGSIRYEKDLQRSGGYTIDISGSERFYLSDLDSAGVDGYNELFSSHPQYFTPDAANTESSYKVSLPAVMQFDIDYHLRKNFYLNLMGSFPLNGEKAFNSRTYTQVALTPRFETKYIGIYLPLHYSSLSKMNAGLSLRFGPVFFGSGSAITALIGESRQVDFHFGLRFGGLFKIKK